MGVGGVNEGIFWVGGGGLTFLWVSGGKGRYILVVRGCVSIFYGWVRVSDGGWKYILGECTWVAIFWGWVGVVTCFIITSLKSVEKLFVSDFDSDDNGSFAMIMDLLDNRSIDFILILIKAYFQNKNALFGCLKKISSCFTVNVSIELLNYRFCTAHE